MPACDDHEKIVRTDIQLAEASLERGRHDDFRLWKTLRIGEFGTVVDYDGPEAGHLAQHCQWLGHMATAEEKDPGRKPGRLNETPRSVEGRERRLRPAKGSEKSLVPARSVQRTCVEARLLHDTQADVHEFSPVFGRAYGSCNPDVAAALLGLQNPSYDFFKLEIRVVERLYQDLHVSSADHTQFRGFSTRKRKGETAGTAVPDGR